MVNIGLKQKKRLSYAGLAIVSILAFVLGLILTFPALLLTNPLGILNFVIIGVIPVLIVASFMQIWTNQDKWIKIGQGDAMGVIELNSTGVGTIYPAIMKKYPEGGITLVTDTGIKEERVYDRNLIHRIVPAKFFAKIGFKKSSPELKNPDIVNLEVPSSRFDQYQFNIDGRSFLVRDAVTGVFFTKDMLNEHEKELTEKNLSANELWEVRKMSKEMEALTSHMMNQLGDTIGGILSNPYFTILIVVVVVIILAFVAMTYGPGLLQSLGFLKPAATQAATTAAPQIIGAKP
jgi:hypothetical protein